MQGAHPLRRTAKAAAAALLLLLPTSGCEPTEDPPDPPTDDDDDDDVVDAELVLGEAQDCPDPVVGIDRFEEVGVARGLDRPLSDPGAIDKYLEFGHGGSSVAQDMDGDGDIDLVFGRVDDPPDLYLNDGDGHFTYVPVAFERDPRFDILSVSAVDVTGDGLPELFVGAAPFVSVLENLGDGRFAAAEVAYMDPGPLFKDFVTHSWGDPDGDGDLDLLLPTTSEHDPTGPPPDDDPKFEGAAEVIVFQSGDGAFDRSMELDVATHTLVGIFTDRDGDGRQDVFIPADLGPPSTFWHNLGPGDDDLPRFEEDAAALGADWVMSGMGVDGADLNGDGELDYCVTDLGPPRCLFSDPSGVYLEPGPGIGLQPDEPVGEIGTVGWSIDFSDLDNDGVLDIIQSSGPFPDEAKDAPPPLEWPNLLWQGDADGGFTDRTAAADFGSLDNDVGLLSADLNGDGALDLVLAGPAKPPKLYLNSCTPGGWLAVDLVGPPGNRLGIGARVEIVAGGRAQVREVQALRGLSQGPARVHFGLGDAEAVESLVIRWTTGSVSRFEDVPGRRRVTVRSVGD